MVEVARTTARIEDGPKFRQVVLVTPDLLPHVWERIEHLFLEAPEQWHGQYTIADIYARIERGEFQLWAMQDRSDFILALITTFNHYPQETTLHLLFWLGSEGRDGLEFMDVLEMWAKKQGATRVTCVGRAALGRMLERHGYRQQFIAFEHDITHMKEH